MTPRFPFFSHRTLAEVAEAWQLRSIAHNGRWRNHGWAPADGRARLAELEARAVEPERAATESAAMQGRPA